ncbi:MAG TPA: DinB family protein [Acidobacteriaceae bacterium]|nr:DinB family protein [Acidobacteriaceae bacterium]
MKLKSCLTAIATLAVSTLLIAPAFAASASPAQVFGKLISGQEEEVVSAAEAMPADKYNFAPTNGDFKGVRTFGQEITHIAEAQYFFFAGFGTKPTIDVKSLDKLTSKDEIVKALKDSFAFAHQATQTMTLENAFEEIQEKDGTNTRVSIAAFSLAHTNDHYGQMIEYLRMNGIVPPASRK